jgi:hypothetical protein
MPTGGLQRPGSTTGRALRSALVASVWVALGWRLGPVAFVLSAGFGLALGVYFRRPHGSDSDGELQAHLARARRRGESVDVLVARLDDAAPLAARRLQSCLRVTDSSAFAPDRSGFELCAMVDRERLDRGALEARLRAITAGPLQIGWSRFPEDGLTLAVLVRQARAACLSPGPAESQPVRSGVAPGWAQGAASR